MDVPVSEFRAHLREWIDRASGGEEVVLTERGRAVARLVPPDYRSLFDKLVAEGEVTLPERPKRPASDLPKVTIKGDVQLSDIIVELRGGE